MVSLLSTELSRLISESNFSRRDLAKIQVDEKLGVQGLCSVACKRHFHGSLIEASRKTYLETVSDISQLPKTTVIDRALLLVKKHQKLTKKIACVHWPGYLCEYFSEVDLSLLRELGKFASETRKQLSNEDSLIRLKTNKPLGMPNLSGEFEKVKTEVWNEGVIEPNLEPEEGLAKELTNDELIQNAIADQANKMFEAKRLNTETLVQMFDTKGDFTSEAADYFCKLLEEQYPGSKFIHLNQCLSSSGSRSLHAVEINVKESDNVFFIFNRSQKKLFDNSTLQNLGHHWAIASFMFSGQVYFGDGLYKSMPTNLKEVLNDYYKIKFDKDIDDIKNLSTNQNFPRQRDGHLCGFIAIMLLTILQDEKVFEFIKSDKSLPQLEVKKFLIFSPSTYGKYIRQILLSAYSSSTINRRMFISDECLDIITNTMKGENGKKSSGKSFQEKFRTVPSRPEKHKTAPKVSKKNSNLRSHNRYEVLNEGTNSRKEAFVFTDKKCEDSDDNIDVVIEDIGSDSDADRNCRTPFNLESPDNSLPGKANDSIHNEQGPSERRDPETYVEKANLVDYELASPLPPGNDSKKNHEALVQKANLVDSDFIGKLVITNKKGAFNHAYKIDSDGYKWKRKWQKVNQRKGKTTWSCTGMISEEKCSAEKSVTKTKLVKQIVVEYTSKHTFCNFTKEAFNEKANEELMNEADSNMNRKDGDKDIETMEGDVVDELIFADMIVEEENLLSQEEQLLNNSDHETSANDNSFECEKDFQETEDATKIVEEIETDPKEVRTENDCQNQEEVGDNHDPHENVEDTIECTRGANDEITEIVNENQANHEQGIDSRAISGENTNSEFVIFKVKRKPMKFERFQIQQFSTKYFVENSLVVFVNGPDGINFDSHTWTDFHGGHGNGKGITTMRCSGSKTCELRKKKWTCSGLCPNERFCCKFFTDFPIQICLYMGEHDHEIVKSGFVNVREVDSTGNEMEFEESTTLDHDKSHVSENETEFSDDISSDDENFDGMEDLELKLNSYEKKIYQRCKQSFEGKEIVIAKHNDLVADTDKIFILKRKKHEKISSISRDGYLYQCNTSRKQMPKVLDDQSYSYSYQCNGKLVCYNLECPVLNRLTVLNSFQYKKSAANICRFCKNELQWEDCEGQKYVLRSQETEANKNKSKYLIVKYEKMHTCGNPEPILNQTVADELKILFENNPELTPSHAYKSLLEKKIRDQKGYKEILSVVHAFTFDHKAKNIKASVKKDMTGNGDDLACMLELQKFLLQMPELELVLRVYTDSYICENCDKYSLATGMDHTLETHCENCQIDKQHTGPIIMLTSLDQIRTAQQMTIEDGAFKYSTLFLDHQNNRIVNFNTFNAFFYDFHIQSISSIFTVHSKFEDRYSINLSFKLFDRVYKEILETEESFGPHGFSSDNAGAISAGLRAHFGNEVLHRTCSFHFLYGAYMHCCNAIGARSAQIQFLRFTWKLLEAATPQKFELLYKLFVKWIEKTNSRQKKLKPWLKFWYNRKTQWATAYTSLSVTGVNLSEAGQSKYKVNNGMKRLKLYQGCVYELGDFLLYSSRLKAMTSQNFIGKGPSRDILDLRESRKAMERIKDHFMTQKDLDDLFDHLGLKISKKPKSFFGSSKGSKKRPFAIADLDDVDEALKKFKPDPKAPYTYKTPKIKDPSNSRKPGRPTGSKKKRPNRNDSLSSGTSIEGSDVDYQLKDSDSEISDDQAQVEVEKIDRKSTTVKKRAIPERNLRSKRKKSQSENSGEHLSKKKMVTDKKNGCNANEEEDKQEEEVILKKSKNDDTSSEPENIKRYKCRFCDENRKTALAIRAHYIMDHEWKRFEYAPIMTEKVEKLSHIFEVVKNGKFRCTCGAICPDAIYKGFDDEAENDFFGRQWIQVHRLVDPRHYTPSKTHRLNDVFPQNLVVLVRAMVQNDKDTDETDIVADLEEQEQEVEETEDVDEDDLSLPDIDKYAQKETFGEVDDCQETEDVDEDDLSLPDIDKYAQKETFGEVDDCQDIEEFNSNSNEDDEILEQQLSDEEDDVRIEEISSEEEYQQTKDRRNRFSSRAKKDRRKDSRTFTNLKKRAKAEAQNYEIRVKSDKKNSITYEVKNLRNKEIYQVTFDEKDVTCNCKSFKEIEERRECAANEVCKHVALIPLYCHENVRENYNGQRWFSTRGAFVRVSEMLKSFDITRNILEKPKHTNFYLYPAPIPNPTRKFAYYKKREYAIRQISKLPVPRWMAEKYNRENNQGAKPACKSCKKKLGLGTLCFRADVTFLFKNRNFKSDEYSLKLSPLRICVKIDCFKDMNQKIQPSQKYQDETNLPPIDTIDMKQIFDSDKIIVKNMLKYENVFFDDTV